MTTRRETTWDGFRAIGLVSGQAEVWIVPELGARIASLRDRRTGREWCWRRADAPWLWANQPGDAFFDSPHAGIDECLPTVGACRHAGRALPDHGEVWSRAWRLEPSQADEIACAVDVPGGGYRFRRTLALDGAELRLHYRLENHGAIPLDFLWSLHPLLAIQPGDEIDLPSEITRFDAEVPRLPDGQRPSWTWPATDGARLDRLELPAAASGCAKLFAGPLRTGRAALYHPGTGDRLEFVWDVASQPWLGLWFTRGGYQGWHHCAIEPTNAPSDTLADAPATAADLRRVPPNDAREWTLRLRMGQAASVGLDLWSMPCSHAQRAWPRGPALHPDS
jgi:galactose mutarotase-like enzyme